jgi:hypothetical protein
MKYLYVGRKNEAITDWHYFDFLGDVPFAEIMRQDRWYLFDPYDAMGKPLKIRGKRKSKTGATGSPSFLDEELRIHRRYLFGQARLSRDIFLQQNPEFPFEKSFLACDLADPLGNIVPAAFGKYLHRFAGLVLLFDPTRPFSALLRAFFREFFYLPLPTKILFLAAPNQLDLLREVSLETLPESYFSVNIQTIAYNEIDLAQIDDQGWHYFAALKKKIAEINLWANPGGWFNFVWNMAASLQNPFWKPWLRLLEQELQQVAEKIPCVLQHKEHSLRYIFPPRRGQLPQAEKAPVELLLAVECQPASVFQFLTGAYSSSEKELKTLCEKSNLLQEVQKILSIDEVLLRS